MSNSRWGMNRAGLLNFWYYDEETFQFNDGKLLLRGSNGSGKSVTMQSFLPVLLDGKKSPDRLDPFGSKARRMEDYLLGEKEVVDRDERTGYLFLEYKKQGTEQYMTTGIGMQARRNKGMKSWYFLITDNRRVGHDFHLAQTQLGEKIPLSAKELENRIGKGGYVVHSQKEYMELVNKYVFGFQSTEAYEDLIKLLIQLRSPKLSKDFKPTVIYEILESALPPLTDDELRHLSDTIESMDTTQQQIEQLERELESIQKLELAYDKYNQYVVAERAYQWKKATSKKNESEKKVQVYKKEIANLVDEIERNTIDLKTYTHKRSVAEQAKVNLQKHEVWSLEQDKQEKKKEVEEIIKEASRLKLKWDIKNSDLNTKWNEKEKVESQLLEKEKETATVMEELSYEGEEAAFLQHEVNVKDLERIGSEQFDFTVWQKEAKEHQALLTSLEKLAENSDSLAQKHEELQRSSSEKKKKVDEIEKEMDHLQEWFDQSQQSLEATIFQWIKDHSKLSFTSEAQQEIARGIQGLYENNRYDAVREKLLASIYEYESSLLKEKANLESKKDNKQKDIDEVEEERWKIKNQKMVEPQRAEGTKKHREQLLEEGKAFIPFYAAVEFKDEVSENQKERLESALKKIGILDSLITDLPLTVSEDAILLTEPKLLGYTLADYLQPDVDEDSPVTKEKVDELLRSISLENDGSGFHIDVDGTYSVGCLVGHAPYEGESKFIGRASRKRHQRQLLNQLEEKIEQIKAELAELISGILEIDQELVRINSWKQSIPTDNDLAEIFGQLVNKKSEWKAEQESLKRIDIEWKSVYEALSQVKVELRQKGSHLNIALKTEQIAHSLKAIRNYVDYLHAFVLASNQMNHLAKELRSLKGRIDEIEEELNEIKGEQNTKESHLQKLQAIIESIEKQLELKGIEEVREEIRRVQQQLEEATEKTNAIHRVNPVKEAEKNTKVKELQKVESDLNFWQNMAIEWERIIAKEKERGFVEIASPHADEIFASFETFFTNNERQKILEKLTKTFYNEQPHLTEYRLLDYTEDEEKPDWVTDQLSSEYEAYLMEWENVKGRRIIQLEYNGQRVSPYFVSSAVKKAHDEQKGWLDEQDRQLYEEIIVNSIGKILRTRIQRAESWVRKMDKIMSERDNSSGLLFSIAWKPLTAESEQEMDTRDLVKLLQRDSKFLNEEDLSSITKHFQSRIARAKELIQLRNEGSTLHQVLKEVLDYRKWFTFVLSFKRENEPNKRELTNNSFFKFSGGEKAMAMYIPLFTAAYSRYKEAGDMAPYIVSLDEAFAGVDENNIRDMFEVVEQLGFNYIMNSQALWGDYDTISSLSICELVRPKNADYVTVIRYEWDGKQRSLVINEEEVMEELFTHE
ncbi:TIGR02680 family protein [Bacillus alkalisoli]|uniref:TIGR02680 family protein n=1 Tax=Bacillus alkalisoli TaxID=2011008 RepID=UPI000C231355|nr:TIGR02680 family protein [Bacillus alkalisoli]